MKKLLIFFLILSIHSFNYGQSPGTGLVFDDQAYEQTPAKAPLVRDLYILPKSASLKKWAPTPKSQGSYGTCVGWASAYAAFTIVEAKRNNWSDKNQITSNAFSPGFIYKLIKSSNDNSCKFGTYVDDAMEVLKTKGVAKYKDLSENCPTNISTTLFSQATKYKIKDYAKLFSAYDATSVKLQVMKKSLAEGNPIVIGMKCPNSFYDAKGYWTPTEKHTGSFGGHAMCVIGYDDNVYGGAFEIQNSWGTDWGNDGYIWIKYTDFLNFTKYAFELISFPDVSTPNTVDMSGNIKFMKSTGSGMLASLSGKKYVMNQSYVSGTRFRIYISNNEPAYVYAIGSDNTKKVFKIFPYKYNISAALTYKQNNVALPDEDHYI